MINELYGLSQALKKESIETHSWHRKLKPIPNVSLKNPCLRIWIGKSSITDIESIPSDLGKVLRKYGDNQGTFPAMNLAPLYRITDDEQKAELERLKKNPDQTDLETIQAWCTENNWTPKFETKARRSMYTTSAELIEQISGGRGSAKEALIHLRELIMAHFSEGPCALLHSTLEQLVFQKITRQENVSLMLTVLFYAGNAGKNINEDNGTLSVIWDVEDWKNYGQPISSAEFMEEINQLLLESDDVRIQDQPLDHQDAFGDAFSPNNEPMPSVKLAGGFESTLHTMFEGQPCQNRYHNFDRKEAAYPLSPGNRASLKQALEWISSEEQKETMWTKTDKNEILFAYPSKLPPLPLPFVALLGASSSEARFTQQAKTLIQCINGIPTEERPESIAVFVLNKVDKARTKVLYTRNTTPEALMTAAEIWTTGCKNLPEFDFVKEGDDALSAPFPLKVAATVNQQWHLDGKTAVSSQTKSMRNYEGIELLLSPSCTINRNYLRIVLTNYSTLIAWYGNKVYAHRRTDAGKQEPQLFRAAVIVGLLLYKCEIRKEQYMESFPYLLGQILKISDELHALYCTVERDNQIPPQLVGSSFYQLATEMPISAFAQLGIRMNPYITWAKAYQKKGKENSRLAAWYLQQYYDIAAKIGTELVRKNRFDEYEKAQLFLGYLAALQRREPKEQPITTKGE